MQLNGPRSRINQAHDIYTGVQILRHFVKHIHPTITWRENFKHQFRRDEKIVLVVRFARNSLIRRKRCVRTTDRIRVLFRYDPRVAAKPVAQVAILHILADNSSDAKENLSMPWLGSVHFDKLPTYKLEFAPFCRELSEIGSSQWFAGDRHSETPYFAPKQYTTPRSVAITSLPPATAGEPVKPPVA